MFYHSANIVLGAKHIFFQVVNRVCSCSFLPWCTVITQIWHLCINPYNYHIPQDGLGILHGTCICTFIILNLQELNQHNIRAKLEVSKKKRKKDIYYINKQVTLGLRENVCISLGLWSRSPQRSLVDVPSSPGLSGFLTHGDES